MWFDLGQTVFIRQYRICNIRSRSRIQMWDYKWKYGEFWVQVLSGSLFCSHASLNPTMCFAKSLLFIFCVLFPFQFVSMHNVLFTMQISFQLYTKPAPNYLSNATCTGSPLALCCSACLYSFPCLIPSSTLHCFKRSRLLLNIDQSVVLQLIHYVNVSLAVVLR